MLTYSKEHIDYLKKIKRNKKLVLLTQIIIIIIFFSIWELLANFKIINTFLYSSPSKIINTVINLFINNSLLTHIGITIYEVFVSFIIFKFRFSLEISCWSLLLLLLIKLQLK